MSEQPKKKGFFSRLFAGVAAPAEAEEKSPDPVDVVDAVEAADVLAGSAAPVEVVDAPSEGEHPSGVDTQPAQPLDATPDQSSSETRKSSWFSRLKSGLAKTSNKLSDGISGLFT